MNGRNSRTSSQLDAEILAQVLIESAEERERQILAYEVACEEEAKEMRALTINTYKDFTHVISTLGLDHIPAMYSEFGYEKAKNLNNLKLKNLNDYLHANLQQYTSDQLQDLAESLMNKYHEIFVIPCKTVSAASDWKRYLLGQQVDRLIEMTRIVFKEIDLKKWQVIPESIDEVLPISVKVEEEKKPESLIIDFIPQKVKDELPLYIPLVVDAEECSPEEYPISKKEEEALKEFIKDPSPTFHELTPTPKCSSQSAFKFDIKRKKTLSMVSLPAISERPAEDEKPNHPMVLGLYDSQIGPLPPAPSPRNLSVPEDQDTPKKILLSPRRKNSPSSSPRNNLSIPIPRDGSLTPRRKSPSRGFFPAEPIAKKPVSEQEEKTRGRSNSNIN